MEDITSREKILKNVRDALVISSKAPFLDCKSSKGFFKEQEEIADVQFAEAFKNTGGKFVYCSNESEFCQNLASIMKAYSLPEVFCADSALIDLLEKSSITYTSDNNKLESSCCSLTRCEHLVAQTGSVLISASDKKSYRVYFTSPIHFVFSYSSQIVGCISEALKGVKSKYNILPDFITFISGPSRTADIEKTLVMGAHGPKELFLFLIDDLD